MDFSVKEIHLRQRADCYNVIGRPKSEAGEHTVPVPPPVLNALREWKLKVPHNKLDLVFGNMKGNIEGLSNAVNRGFMPVQVAAGIITAEGKAKYTGLHALRHFFASWCINRRQDGGPELPAKLVQKRLGHSSITMTMDV